VIVACAAFRLIVTWCEILERSGLKAGSRVIMRPASQTSKASPT